MVENTQRDIDIAFVNELSILMPKLGLDVEKVLEAADTKWNFHRHTPGLGGGGHCIPIDPHYYIQIANSFGVNSSLSPAARKLNSSMPLHNAKELLRLCDGIHPKRVLVLGCSYKPNVSDTRETPVRPFISHLMESGSEEVFVWDPHLREPQSFPPGIIIDDPYSLSNLDCVVLATAHREILEMNWRKLKESTSKPRFYDSRRCLNKDTMSEIGWEFHAIGLPR